MNNINPSVRHILPDLKILIPRSLYSAAGYFDTIVYRQSCQWQVFYISEMMISRSSPKSSLPKNAVKILVQLIPGSLAFFL